jgi:hypothetical protein
MKSQKAKTLFICVVIVLGIFFSLGKIRYALNPYVRQLRLHQFIGEIKSTKQIDPEKFWEFRDFYSATTSTFRPENIAIRKPFLIFSTPYFESNDFLVSTKPNLVYPQGKGVVEVILQNNNELVYAINNKLHIQFVKSQEEMKKANGFFSYFGTDLTPYNEYLWYSDTTLNL